MQIGTILCVTKGKCGDTIQLVSKIHPESVILYRIRLKITLENIKTYRNSDESTHSAF